MTRAELPCLQSRLEAAAVFAYIALNHAVSVVRFVTSATLFFAENRTPVLLLLRALRRARLPCLMGKEPKALVTHPSLL